MIDFSTCSSTSETTQTGSVLITPEPRPPKKGQQPRRKARTSAGSPARRKIGIEATVSPVAPRGATARARAKNKTFSGKIQIDKISTLSSDQGKSPKGIEIRSRSKADPRRNSLSPGEDSARIKIPSSLAQKNPYSGIKNQPCRGIKVLSGSNR